MTAVIALLTISSGLGNGFAYDDVAVIVDNPALHQPGAVLPRAFSPYLGGQLFRPFPLLGFAAQWTLGEGSPIPFRLVSLGLYALVSVLVFLLCRRAGATTGAALAGALVFAVHPVHSEVTANTVGQLELIATVAVLGAVVVYLRARARPKWRRLDTLLIAGLYLIAIHAKESAYVLPAILILVELLVVSDPRSWRGRLSAHREFALIVLAVFLGSLAIRNYVLGGMAGGIPHPSLEGLGIGGRARLFLELVPEWTRLLVWPARLQAEYGPPAFNPGAEVSAARQLPGLLIVLAALTVVAGTWRRMPLLALGLGWVVVTLAPVANLLFPTGILLAERTLFLPSVGLALLAAGAAGQLRAGLASYPGMGRFAGAGFGVLLAVGAVRSAIRQPAWRDTMTILEQTALDARESYRVQMVYGRVLRSRGLTDSAEVLYRRSVGLWNRDALPYEELGGILRARGACAEAIPILAAGVIADSTSDVARSRLVECLIVERRWTEAEAEAERGLAQGVVAYQHAMDRIRAARQEGLLN